METGKQLTVKEAADSLIKWAYGDSHVELNRLLLIDHLLADQAFSGRVPTEEECELMITGGDEGDGYEQLEPFFPKTSDFIASHW